MQTHWWKVLLQILLSPTIHTWAGFVCVNTVLTLIKLEVILILHHYMMFSVTLTFKHSTKSYGGLLHINGKAICDDISAWTNSVKRAKNGKVACKMLGYTDVKSSAWKTGTIFTHLNASLLNNNVPRIAPNCPYAPI